jgi:hypothetical protein
MLFFPRGRSPAAAHLERAHEHASTFEGDRPLGVGWHIDQHEITNTSTGMEFSSAVTWLFEYRLYPEDVLTADAHFLQEGRLPRPGDRIVQSIRVFQGLLNALAINVVTSVLHQPGRRGLTMQTTTAHFQQGEMSVMVSERPGGAALLFQSVSRSNGRVPFFMRGYARRLQLQAHQAMLAGFTALGSGEVSTAP